MRGLERMGPNEAFAAEVLRFGQPRTIAALGAEFRRRPSILRLVERYRRKERSELKKARRR